MSSLAYLDAAHQAKMSVLRLADLNTRSRFEALEARTSALVDADSARRRLDILSALQVNAGPRQLACSASLTAHHPAYLQFDFASACLSLPTVSFQLPQESQTSAAKCSTLLSPPQKW